MSKMTKVDPITGEILDHKGRPLTATGAEIPDPTPMQPPVGYKRQKPLHELIREMVRSEKLAQEAQAAGMETFEEAEDFDLGEDDEPYTPYETEALDGFIQDGIRSGRIRSEDGQEPAFYPEQPLERPEAAPAPTPAPEPVKTAPKPSTEQGS